MAKKKPIQIILLGSGESGKSTIAKQLKILFGGGFSETERESYRNSICSNLIHCMRTLMQESTKIDKKNKVKYKPTSKELTAGEGEHFSLPFSDTIVKDITELWKDKAIQHTYANSNKFQLPDCAKYLFENVARISQPDYLPTEEDLIHNRTKTTGIHEYDFMCKDIHFHLIDVGGQRSERKKWLSFFTEVDCAIFVTALSEYDMKLYEDQNV